MHREAGNAAKRIGDDISKDDIIMFYEAIMSVVLAKMFDRKNVTIDSE